MTPEAAGAPQHAPAARHAPPTNDLTKHPKSGHRDPDTARHKEKWRLALDMLDEAIGWGLVPPLVAADAGYGDAAEFRQGLEDRALRYVVQIASTASAHPQAAQRCAPVYHGQGRPPVAKYRGQASSVKELALAAGQSAAQPVTWRQGSNCTLQRLDPKAHAPA